MAHESTLWAWLANFLECQNKTIRPGSSLKMDVFIAQIDDVGLPEAKKITRQSLLLDGVLASISKNLFLLLPTSYRFSPRIASLIHSLIESLWDQGFWRWRIEIPWRRPAMLAETCALRRPPLPFLEHLWHDIEALNCFLVFLQRLLLILALSLVLLVIHSEFPSGRRYLCTTMPWTIWPALAVLWGVCWMFYPSPTEGQLALENLDLLLDRLDQEEISTFACWLVQHESQMFRNMERISERPNPGGLDSPQPQHPHETESLDRSKTPSTVERLSNPPDDSIPTIGIEYETNATSDDVPSIDCPACGKKFSRRDIRTRHQKESCEKNQGQQSDHRMHFCLYSTCRRSKESYGFKRQAHLRQHLDHCNSHRQKLAESSKSHLPQTASISAASSRGRKRQANGNLSLDEVGELKGESEGSDSGKKTPEKWELEERRRDLARELEKLEDEFRRKRQRLEGLDARIQSLEGVF